MVPDCHLSGRVAVTVTVWMGMADGSCSLEKPWEASPTRLLTNPSSGGRRGEVLGIDTDGLGGECGRGQGRGIWKGMDV